MRMSPKTTVAILLTLSACADSHHGEILLACDGASASGAQLHYEREDSPGHQGNLLCAVGSSMATANPAAGLLCCVGGWCFSAGGSDATATNLDTQEQVQLDCSPPPARASK